MKALLSMIILLASFSSFAYPSVECKSMYAENNKYVVLNLDRYSPSIPFINMNILGIDQGVQTYNKSKTVSLITPSSNFYELRYWGSGVDLKVDTFPDNSPRPGMMYNATFSDMDLFGGMTFTELRCEYFYY